MSQYQEVSLADATDCRRIMARWLASPGRCGHPLEHYGWRYRGSGQTATTADLPDHGHRPVGRLRSRQRYYEALSSERVKLDAAPGASVDAAVAAANRATLLQLVPSQQTAIDSAYQAALSAMPARQAQTAGLAVGEKAAAAILAWRAEDGAATAETYRPHTTAGVYVPTVIPVVSQWPQRTPWLMTSPAQFRPGPPPPLTSEVWTRDYNEIKALGSKNSTRRTAEQTAIARSGKPRCLPSITGSCARSPPCPNERSRRMPACSRR